MIEQSKEARACDVEVGFGSKADFGARSYMRLLVPQKRNAGWETFEVS